MKIKNNIAFASSWLSLIRGLGVGLLWLVAAITAAAMAMAMAQASETQPSFLALGDSYTIGEGVTKNQRWPERLQAQLALQGLELAKPEVIARTGWRAAQLLGAIKRKQSNKTLNKTYALVSLMIGVNDQYQGRSVAEFKADLELLIKQAIELAGGKPEQVLLISIPDWGFSPFARFQNGIQIGRQIDAFNTVLKSAGSRYSLNFVDVTPVSRLVADEDFVEDGLHPSKQQHQRWVDEAIAPAALMVLQRVRELPTMGE